MNEKPYKLFCGDALEVMPTLEAQSIDLCLTDLPYGITACKWDSVIPFAPMWENLKRLCKPKAAICLFGSQPFTSALVMSNPKMFRYEWIWNKKRTTGFLDSKKRPLKQHENVVVFYQEQCLYKPQLHSNKLKRDFRGKNQKPSGECYGRQREYISNVCDSVSFPRSIIEQTAVVGNSMEKVAHPTQKPVELLRYLIRTYTQENETVLDFTMGSGSCGVAALLENRKFIGIEKDENYFEIAKARIEAATQKEPLFAEVTA